MDTLKLALITFLPLIVLLGIPALGLTLGWWIDREHRLSLDYRRRQLGHVLITDLRSYPGMAPKLSAPGGAGSGGAEVRTELVVAEVVLACNAFLAAIARIKMIFGGEVRALYGVITRARQEAVLRVMEQAAHRGYDAVCNLRLEGVDLSGETVRTGKNHPRIYVAIIAYGMAYRRAPGIYPPPAAPTLMDYPH